MSDFTLNDLRARALRFLKPGLLDRLARWFMPREMRQILSDTYGMRDFRRMVGIINAMTPAERHCPDVIDASRRTRIARGAGVPPEEVLWLVKQYEAMTPVIAQNVAGSRRLH